MPSPQGPLLPRRRLGAELRRLRGERTLDEVAADTLISTSKLSRLENGQGVPQQRDIRDLISFYDVDRATSDRLRRWMNEGRRQAWWREYSEVISDSFDVFLDFESGASLIRTYMPLVLPGLLQTEAYARRLVGVVDPGLTPDQVDKLVQVRLRRQAMLSDDEDATRLIAVIDEAAIRRAVFVGSDGDSRTQLEHLAAMSQRRNVSIRILPFDVGLHSAVMNNFTVFQFAEDIDRDVVHIELQVGDYYLEQQSRVLGHLRLFDTIAHQALDDPDSYDLLTRLVEAPHHHKEQK